jgi:hypothetical protein
MAHKLLFIESDRVSTFPCRSAGNLQLRIVNEPQGMIFVFEHFCSMRLRAESPIFPHQSQALWFEERPTRGSTQQKSAFQGRFLLLAFLARELELRNQIFEYGFPQMIKNLESTQKDLSVFERIKNGVS